MRLPKLRSLLPVLSAAALCLALAACKSDEQKLAEFLDRGKQALDAEKYDEAVIEYRNVLQLDPNHPEAHYALARSYTALQKLKEAYWELHEAVRLDPSNIDARVSFAQFSLLAKDYEEVLAQADAIVAQEPDRASAYTLRGEALTALERFDEAEQAFAKAIEVAKPEDAPSHLSNMVQFQSRRGNLEAARTYIDRLVELEPSFRSYSILGRHLVRTGESAGAEAAFKKALEVAKQSRSVGYRNLAGFYFNEDRLGDAVATLEKGIEVADDDGKLDLIYLLARFYISQGDTEKADALVEQATEAKADDAQPWLVLSAYRGRQSDFDGALAAVDKALEIDPKNRAAQLRKAELKVDTGYRNKDDAAIAEGRAIVDDVLAVEPSNPEALFVRAKIEMAELDPKAAAQTLRSALDIRPDWAQGRFVLGSALMLLGDQNGARAELARAVELDPALLEARRALARIHSALGEHEYAIEQGRAYLREKPDDAATRILVAQSLVNLGKRDEAFAELSKIPEADRDADSWYAVGRMNMVEGKLDAAREALLRADAGRPNHPDILDALHRIDVRTGRLDESLARIRKAVEAEPENPKLAMLEGNAALAQRDLAGAEAAYKRAVELDPADSSAFQRLAGFYSMTNRLDESVATLQRSLEKNPNDARLHERLATLLEYQGKVDDAMRHYEEAIGLDSSLGESKNNLAYLIAEKGGDLDRALDLAQEAKALLPDNPSAADTLGWVLFKRGIPSAAIGYLREAVAGFGAEDDRLGIVRYHLAQAYEANEQPDKALETLEEALTAAQRGASKGREPSWLADVRTMAERLRKS
ncbi:MAG: tetratricopeptide repeat protein [Myxococcota bacterium]